MAGHVMFCRQCGNAWLDLPGEQATDPACICLLTRPDWVTDPHPASLPLTAWQHAQDLGRYRARREFSWPGPRVEE